MEENKEVSASLEAEKQVSKTSGLKPKDYFGYALGDFAGCMAFASVTTLLQRYYTDVFGLSPLFILIMFMVARVWDAINDPMMGRIVDKKKPGKQGRYRIWMKIAAIPLAVATILLFLPWPGLISNMGKIGIMVYATITYIFFGMVYTMHQIPYGSLASVVTTDDKERNGLSVYRSIGAALGNIPILLITMLWTVKKDVDGATVEMVDYTRTIIGIAIVAVLVGVLLFFGYKLNKERVVAKATENKEKAKLSVILSNLLKNRSFVAISLVGMLLLAGQMFTQSFYTYLFSYKFEKGWMNLVSMAMTYLPMVILMPFMGKLIRKFGKKEICAFGAFLAAAANLALFAMRGVTNLDLLSFIFLAFCFISGFGLSIITLEIWAVATDAIDDVEVKTGMKNDGSAYSIFMFFRKLGQVLAAIVVNVALLSIHYLTEDGAINKVAITENVGMFYDLATIIPAVIFGAMGLIMLLLYGLNKKKTDELQVAKKEMLAKQIENDEIAVGEEATTDN